MKSQKNHLKLSQLCALLCLLPLLISSVCTITTLLLNSRKSCEESVYRQMNIILDDRIEAIRHFVINAEVHLKMYGTAPCIKEVLVGSEDPEEYARLLEEAQTYTSQYFGHLTGWEGIYTSDWDTVVKVHSSLPAVGMQTRKGDDLVPYRATMTSQPDGFFDGGAFVSPASGQMILNLRQAIYNDAGQPIGLIGGGPFLTDMATYLAEVEDGELTGATFVLADYNQNVYVLSNDERYVSCAPIEDEMHVQLLTELQEGEGESFQNFYTIDGGKAIVTVKAIPEYNMALLMYRSADGIYDGMKATNVLTISVIIIIMLLCLALIIWIGRRLDQRCGSFVSSVENMANGNIGSSISADMSLDELAKIATATQSLRDKLCDVVGNIQNEVTYLAGTAEEVNEMLGSCKESADRVSVAVVELSQGSSQMAEDVQDVNMQISVMNDNIGDIAGAVDSLSKASKEMEKAKDDASGYIASMERSSNQSTAYISEISGQIRNTNDAIGKISEAIDMIREIADQTNLLALNASIEAAKAGEGGKGFAVVAEEIKKLAEQSNNSAVEIQQIAEEIINKSEETMSLSKDVEKSLQEEKSIFVETKNCFATLSKEIVKSVQEISSISQQTDSIEGIRNEIMDKVSSLSAISEENTASNEEVSNSITRIAGNISEINDKVNALNKMSIELDKAMTFFRK